MMQDKRTFVGSRAYWLAVAATIVLMTLTWSLLAARGQLNTAGIYLLVMTHAPLVLMAILAPLVRQRLTP